MVAANCDVVTVTPARTPSAGTSGPSAAIHVFSARAYDAVDPRGRRWPQLERALDGYLRPYPTDGHVHDEGGPR